MGATWTVVKCQKMERGNELGDVGIGTPFSLQGSALRRPGVNGAAFLCRDHPYASAHFPGCLLHTAVMYVVWSAAWPHSIVFAGLALARAQRIARRLPRSRLLRGISLKETSALPAMGPSTLPQPRYT